MIVLGIDVGLRVTGFVVCDIRGSQIDFIKEGEIKTKSLSTLPQRVFNIYKELAKVIDEYQPKVVVLERLYSHHRHPTTISLLAQVRGVTLLLIEQRKLGFFEYSPTKARKSILGRGSAESFQVKKMAENLLGRELISEHTADAFSLVVAFSHTLKAERLKR